MLNLIVQAILVSGPEIPQSISLMFANNRETDLDFFRENGAAVFRFS